MKTRSGFVSNSSSTSFTCDVCGEDVSGMDLSLRDSGMLQCWNGHTFCEGHQIGEPKELTIEEKKQALVDNAKGFPLNSWWTAEKREARVQELQALDDEIDIEDRFHDLEMDSGINPLGCPICQFIEAEKKDSLKFALSELGISQPELLKRAKDKFGTYEKFKEFLTAKEK